MPYAYRKSERIRKNTEFLKAMKGKRLSIDGLYLFYRKNDADNFRIGISVSKKLANAVKRNRLRRQLRNCISKALGDHAAGYDLVFVARQGLAGLAFEQIQSVVMQALRRSSILGQRAEDSPQ